MTELTFRNQDRMPALGLGTWKSDPGEVGEAVREAIRIGYRHIDCAAIYGNEAEVGQALRDAIGAGEVRRDHLWITSKLWNNAHLPEHVEPALQRTLDDLQLDCLDLYLMHWPIALKPDVAFPEDGSAFLSWDEAPLTATWEALERCVQKGLARHIGVSNFSRTNLVKLENASIRPEMNQIELHPLLQQNDLVADCRATGIHVTAYSPLGSRDRPPRLVREGDPVLLETPRIIEIARKHEATPAQVLIAWAIQRGTAVIPKSVNPRRLRENFDAARLELDRSDLDAIAGLDKHFRFVDGEVWTSNDSPYSRADLWDE